MTTVTVAAITQKASIFVAGASLLIGQSIDLQLSGAQVVGWAVGAVGFLIAGMLSMLTWFASREFNSIKDTQKEHGIRFDEQDTRLIKIEGSVETFAEWKRVREAAHEEANKEAARLLRAQIESRGRR